MNPQSIIGIFTFVGLACLLSEDRKRIGFKTALAGVLIQFIIALILLKIPAFKTFFIYLNKLILFLEESTREGTSMVFGYLGGGPLPFEEKIPGASYILAFRGLPLILVMSALSSLLFYWGVLPRIVKGFSVVLQKTMKIGGAEGVGVSANIFVGMVESPLFIRPYLKDMTRSELFSLMTCGMSTIAGTVMVLYASILGPKIPDVLGHILIASIISAPAAITIAKIMIPENEPLTSGRMTPPEQATSSMDALTTGTLQGVQLLINIIAMLIVLVALVKFVNLFLGLLPTIGGTEITLQRILGYIMAPVVWIMGVPWSEAPTAGALLGTKTVINEFVAYLELSRLPEGSLSPGGALIMTYALCGFANPGSLGIMIGGMGTMAPERRNEIVSLGFRSIVAGTMAACMTGAIVGFLGG